MQTLRVFVRELGPWWVSVDSVWLGWVGLGWVYDG